MPCGVCNKRVLGCKTGHRPLFWKLLADGQLHQAVEITGHIWDPLHAGTLLRQADGLSKLKQFLHAWYGRVNTDWAYGHLKVSQQFWVSSATTLI